MNTFDNYQKHPAIRLQILIGSCLLVLFLGRLLGFTIFEKFGVFYLSNVNLLTFLTVAPVIIGVAVGAHFLRSRMFFVNTFLLMLLAVGVTPYPLTGRFSIDTTIVEPRVLFVSTVSAILSIAVVVALRLRSGSERFQFSLVHLILLLTVVSTVLAMWRITGG